VAIKKYDKYMPEKKANSKADEKTREETYQQFRKLYEHFLYDLYRLQEDATHNHVIEDIDEFQLEKYGLKKSIKMALNKNKHLLESYLDSSDEDEDEDDDDSEEEEEEEKKTNPCHRIASLCSSSILLTKSTFLCSNVPSVIANPFKAEIARQL
jgi:hypothetical protein